MHINAGLNTGSTSSSRRLREGTMDQANILLVILWFPTKLFQKLGFYLNMGVSGFHLWRRKPVLFLDTTFWGYEFYPSQAPLFSKTEMGEHLGPALRFSLMGTFILQRWMKEHLFLPHFSPHGYLYSLKGEWKVISLPHRAFPSRVPLFLERGMEEHLLLTFVPTRASLFHIRGMEEYLPPSSAKFSPYGPRYSPKGNGRVSPFRPLSLPGFFPDGRLYSPKGNGEYHYCAKFSPHGHLYCLGGME